MPRIAKWPFVEETSNGWRASVRIDQKRVKGVVRETPQEAHQDAVALLERRKGNPIAAMTLTEVLEEILKDCERRERRPATAEFYRSHLGVFTKHFGAGKVLATITVGDVQDFIDARRETVTGLTIKHDLMALTRAMRFAGIEPNPVKSTKLIRPKVRKRDPGLRMAWSEVMDVLHKITGADYAVLAFVAGTGVRRTEFARMRHQDIDLEGDRIVIPVGKTEPRELPLPKAASSWETCETVLGLNPKGKFLLPGEGERDRVRFLQDTILRARAATGQKRLQLHELRRAFASRIAEKFPVPIVSALLGHALPGTTGLYVHADHMSLRKAMDDLWRDFHVEKPSKRRR